MAVEACCDSLQVTPHRLLLKGKSEVVVAGGADDVCVTLHKATELERCCLSISFEVDDEDPTCTFNSGKRNQFFFHLL